MQLSHVIGATTPPLLTQTIGQALEDAARRFGEVEAVVSVHESIRWTYEELNAKAGAFAAGLLALGLEKGDRVGVWSPNNAEWTLTQFAAAKAGLILVTINPAYRVAELEYTINKVGVKALVCAERLKTSAYVEMVESVAPEIAACEPGQLASERMPPLKSVIKIGGAPRPGWFDFGDVAHLARPEHRAALDVISTGLNPGDPITIQFTSGTTGLPKGATLSHQNILNNGYFVGRAIGLIKGDRVCIPVPLYHCFGMVMGNLGCLTHGATMVYPSDAFDPLAVLQCLQAERCTALYGVPTMFIGELGHPEFERFDLGALRTGIMAGSPCPVEVMKQVTGRMHMSGVTIAYGMTETSPVSFQTGLDDPTERRISTVGRVQPHIE
jgi:fatty-acyl-CoA synthase